MSDETPPPPLRLRPRVREKEPEASSVSSPAEPVPSPQSAIPSAPAADDGVKRFRLKPKLSFDTEAQKTDSVEEIKPEPSASIPLVPMPVLAPDIPLPVVPPPVSVVDTVPLPILPDPEGDGMPRLKLKAVSAEASTASVPSSVESPASVTIPGVPVSVPFPPPPASLPTPMIGGIPRAVGVPRPLVPRTPLVPVLPSGKADQKKRGLLIASLVVLPLMGCGLAYWFLGASKPEPLPASVQPQPVAAAPQVDPALSGDSSSANAGLGRPVSGAQDVPPMPTVSEAPVPVRVAPSGPSAATVAAFRAWVDGVQISGVVSGRSPRAIINGRLVKMGDVIEPNQGIVFDGVDSERKEVVFRTNNGLIGGKGY
jgi:hypothetical protein